MASAHKYVNWTEVKADYVSDPMATYNRIAAKYSVTAASVQWHAQREKWFDDRREHSKKVAQKLSEKSSDSAADQLAAIHRAHLRATKELREMISHKLKTRTSDGVVVLRHDVSAGDLANIARAYAVLLESDRIALGADELPVNSPRDPFSDLSDDQLFAKLRSTLERHPAKTLQ